MSDDTDLQKLADLWRERDPLPDGLVERMQALARAEVDLLSTDWDHELLQLVERSTELVGARSASSALTLRFAEGDVELMVRIVDDGDGRRLDGWVMPIIAMTATVVEPGGAATGSTVRVDPTGRFELTGLDRGLVRLRLDPDDADRTPILTPTFEI
jgi:hypothetical protein